jgi:phage terminase large subunit
MALSPAQEKICKDDSRFVVAVTGRRFGKTHCAIRQLAKHAAQKEGAEVWYLSPSYRMSRQIVWDKLKNKLKDLKWVEKTNESEMSIRLKNGSKISLKGADNFDSLRGVGLDYIVLDEFQDISPRAWTEVLRPTLSDKMGKAMFTGTPRGVGSWSHEMYTEAQERDDWGAHTYKTIDGGIVTPQEIEQAKRELDDLTYQQEYEATFTTWRKSVCHSFDRNKHIQPYLGPKGELHIGMDFNVTPGTAVIAHIDHRMIHIFDEIHLEGTHTQEMCDVINNKYPGVKKIVYPDPACRQKRTSAGGKTDLSILQNNGFICKLRNHHTAVKDRVNALNTKLKNAANEIGILIDPKCKNLIKSLERLSYRDDSSIIDKDGHEHIFDACSYMVDYLYPVQTQYDNEPVERFTFRGGRF